MNLEPHIFKRLQEAYQYRHEPEEMHLLAEALWRTLLFVAMILVVLWIWYGITQLIGVVESSQVSTSSNSGLLPLSTTELYGAVHSLQVRQTETKSLTTTPVSAPDPAVAK